jgi:hypothetical protein
VVFNQEGYYDDLLQLLRADDGASASSRPGMHDLYSASQAHVAEIWPLLEARLALFQADPIWKEIRTRDAPCTAQERIELLREHAKLRRLSLRRRTKPCRRDHRLREARTPTASCARASMGHLTGSAWVVSADRTPDSSSPTTGSSASGSSWAATPTGIRKPPCGRPPRGQGGERAFRPGLKVVQESSFDVDRHWIRRPRQAEPGHWHHDLRFHPRGRSPRSRF